MKKIFNSIVIFCALGCMFSLNAQTNVDWTNLVGVTASGNTVTKTGANGWDAGASSSNLLAAGADGWAETIIAETTTNRMFSLNDVDNSAHHSDLDFAIYVKSDGSVYVFESGTNRGVFGTYVANDVFRIERVSGSILYKKNGTTFYTSVLNSTGQLIVDCSIFTTGATISNAVAFFNGSGGPTCSDGIQNGNETGVDCGGSCDPCVTCFDGIQNGNETGVDCGGSCDPCSTGGGTGGGFFVNDDGPNDVDIRYSEGKVVVGDSTLAKPGDYRLYVGGGVLTEKVKVAIESTGDWADYVFEKNHNLISLQEVEKSIIEHKHLPNVPSADKMVENGLDVAKMDATLLRQIEELWLHTIELKKENEALKKRLEALENKK